MPKESGYFEEAARLFDDGDTLVSQTARRLYNQMISRYRRDDLAPRPGFNILYFFQSSVRALIEVAEIAPSSIGYRYSGDPIRATNFPGDLGKWSDCGNDKLLKKYVEIVTDDSDPDGDDFDVSYAIEILATAFKNGHETTTAADTVGVDDFDYWISGFNREK